MTDPIVHDGPEDYCFGCGQRNEDGLRLSYRRTSEASVECEYTVPEKFRGAEGIVHGGIQATLLDEVMGLAAHSSLRNEPHKIVTVDFRVRYRRPTTIGTPLLIRGRVDRVEDSNMHLTGEIVDADGEVLTEGEARWKRLA
jgi:uncharacterized protein (TIGR00369 family)